MLIVATIGSPSCSPVSREVDSAEPEIAAEVALVESSFTIPVGTHAIRVHATPLPGTRRFTVAVVLRVERIDGMQSVEYEFSVEEVEGDGSSPIQLMAQERFMYEVAPRGLTWSQALASGTPELYLIAVRREGAAEEESWQYADPGSENG